MVQILVTQLLSANRDESSLAALRTTLGFSLARPPLQLPVFGNLWNRFKFPKFSGILSLSWWEMVCMSTALKTVCLWETLLLLYKQNWCIKIRALIWCYFVRGFAFVWLILYLFAWNEWRIWPFYFQLQTKIHLLCSHVFPFAFNLQFLMKFCEALIGRNQHLGHWAITLKCHQPW